MKQQRMQVGLMGLVAAVGVAGAGEIRVSGIGSLTNRVVR